MTFIVVVAFPWLALAVRRLHDTGLPGHYLLLACVPFGLIALIRFFAQPGDPGTNQFGQLPDMLCQLNTPAERSDQRFGLNHAANT